MDFIDEPGLVLYLPLSEADGASFISKDKHGHLSTVTGADWKPDGRSFDGADDFIAVPDADSLDFGTGDFTIEVWAKSREKTGTFQTMVAKNNYSGESPAGEYKWVFWLADSGQLSWYRNNGGFLWAGNYTGDNTWHHFVVLRKGNAGYLYADAIQVDYQGNEHAGFSYSSDVDLRIGRSGADAYPFKGEIGEVRIYNRCLTPQEIRHNYLATKRRYR